MSDHPSSNLSSALTLESRALLDNLLTGVLVVDAQLQVLFANTAAEQLLPLSKRRLQGGAVYLHDEDAALDMSLDLARIRHCISLEQGFTDSEVQLTIEGLSRWVEVSVTPLPAAVLCSPAVDKPSADHPIPEQVARPALSQGLALVEIHLIDQQKKISQELQQRTQQQVARELVRGLAHEIKNPLGGLRGAAQLLERELEQELGRGDLKEFTQLIIAQADRLSNLVDRLLGPQRMGQRQAVNLHAVLERVRQLVALELPAAITLVRDYDPSIPELEVEPEQLEQALLNIVRNAAQALTEQAEFSTGQILLKTRTAHQVMLQGQRYRLAATIHIIDNGPGIAEILRDTLFYPMVTGRQGGTGLGLSLAQDIIQQHNGRIESHSRPGHTEFIIYLPLKH
ncbi:two-component system sensor histidine kinase NtrB [Oceanisphaera profunda]|uniref:Sensory histidine kinase/phosphatase NtrB n=1 Tax=Oceanisphaera profunda TaxID=1416627 RepID=A0A1Y0D8S2_9GAMM|nr:nitrogen regulation protein NR(II) [Oceanisphaera profunda]ART83991.1 two-component system sensor histidine kinase NtrB [Oceanisphaera profunda]